MKLHIKDKVLIAAIILLLGGCTALFAAPVTLAWSDVNVAGTCAGYNIYTNGVMAINVTGQANTNCTLNLPAGVVLVNATAVAFDGTESDFSNTCTNTLLNPVVIRRVPPGRNR